MTSTSARPKPSATVTSLTDMTPAVTVPVLSMTMVSTRLVDSSTSGPLMSRPICAPRPVPTSSAVGVASPSAHGQAMISTATAAVNAGARPEPRANTWISSVRAAMIITTGTNTCEIWSTRRWTGAFLDWASVTSLAIWASVVFSPVRVTSTSRRPEVFMVAPVTFEPAVTSTGMDSPVSIDSSTAEDPSVTRPSVAIFSPGRTTNTSPTCSWPIGTRTSRPSRRTAASLAPMSSSALSAAEDCPLALVSNQRPSSRNEITTAVVSR